jgi:hypothetical protein
MRLARFSLALLLISLSSWVALGAWAADGISIPERDWQLFRAAFPFHVQTIAVSAPDGQGERTLVVSEPPPHATPEGILAVDNIRLAKGVEQTWPIGFDGWVKDMVFRLPKTTDAELKTLVASLSRYLYSSDYKPIALELPVDTKRLAMKAPLDVQVTTADLEGWYQNQAFTASPNEKPLRLSDARPGVYTSVEPGLVVWIAPKRGIEGRKEDVRRFGLDSDLILGAVDRKDSIAVFGRERVAPLTILPPIRTEVVMDLAAATGAPLAQSYERHVFGAGPAQPRWDWAPIYLSPELLDSEYGSVLNFTDQMLKSWSGAGQVEYYNFPHPIPSRLPFDGPLVKQLRVTTLLYNWNTSGFGMMSKGGRNRLYTVTRTGALGVTYRAEGWLMGDLAVSRAEDHAYSYFAALNNPMLARVVQYASLYQAFRAFGVTAPPQRIYSKWEHREPATALAKAVLTALRNARAADVESAAQTYMTTMDARLKVSGQPLKQDKEQIVDMLSLGQAVYRRFYTEHKDVGEDALAHELSGARGDAPVPVANRALAAGVEALMAKPPALGGLSVRCSYAAIELLQIKG